MIYISAVGMINALGNNLDEIATNLTRGVAPGMRPRAGWLQGHPQAVLAGVDGELPLIPEKFAAHRSRNNQILLAALAQIQPQVDDAIAKYGRERIAIVLGTSTSGLHEGDTHVNLRTHGQPSTTWHYAQTGTRRSVAFSQPLAGARRPGLYPFNRLLFQRQSDNQRAQAYRSGAGRCRHCGWRRHPEPDAD